MGGYFSSDIRCPSGTWSKPHSRLNWTSEFSAELIREIKETDTHRSLKPCILFAGPSSSGKSSLVNTLLSAGSSDLVYKAETGWTTASLTTRFTRYDGVKELRNTFRMCDTSGILDEELGITRNDLRSVMNGHVATGYKFLRNHDITDDDPHYVEDPTDQDKSHCLVIVISSKHVDEGLKENYTDKVQKTIGHARDIGIPIMIILTKADLFCQTLKSDKTKVFACPHVKNVVTKTSELFGVPQGLIYPVINYSTERSKHDGVANEILALLALRRMVKLANDYLEGNELD